MKTCSRCGVPKPVDAFGVNRAKTDGRQTQCKECRRLTNTESYLRTKGYHNPKRTATQARNMAKNHAFIRQYLLTHPCVDCGEADIVVLQFDHQGDKTADVSRLRNSSLAKLVAEILKCEVVCANCHIRRTAKAFSWWRTQAVE